MWAHPRGVRRDAGRGCVCGVVVRHHRGSLPGRPTAQVLPLKSTSIKSLRTFLKSQLRPWRICWALLERRSGVPGGSVMCVWGGGKGLGAHGGGGRSS